MGHTSSLKITPVDATLGAVVTGVKLADIDANDLAALYEAWLEYAVLIFPDQHLDDAEQIAFARRLGTLEFKLTRLSNLDDDGRVHQPDDAAVRALDGNRFWHCDSTFYPVQAKGAVFTARVVPSAGGETQWADMRAAYDALDEDMRARVQGLSAYHSLLYSQSRCGYVSDPDAPAMGDATMFLKELPLRPLVKVHPETGRKALNIGRHAFGIPGLDPEESQRLLDELVEFACQPPRVCTHTWAAGDCVLWDNRCVTHRVQPWDMSEARDMRHTRLAGHPLADFAPTSEVDVGAYVPELVSTDSQRA
jgi:alpha-ketoglutarate-dependent taurine dioxygenase